MDPVRLVERVAAFDDASRDRAEITAVLRDVAALRRWLAAREAKAAAALRAVAAYPEKTMADETRVPLRDAEQAVERAGLLGAAPALAAALEDGRVDAAHVDALGRGLRGLDPAQRRAVLSEEERLAAAAAACDADEFRRVVKRETDRVRAESGQQTLERQRRDARLWSWADRATGMWCLSGRFDADTGAELARRLRAAKEHLFRTAQPATAPDDPVERDQHLAACALVELLLRPEGVPTSGRTEVVAVVEGGRPPDERGDHVDWGLPVELPVDVLHRLLGAADVHTIVTWNGLVLHAPGRLDLGRTTRIANAAQRRALRALYRTCGLPGCHTRFDECRIHHVHWWRHGGATDLANLLPLCSHHHARLHAEGWQLHLGPNRELTVTLPDGTVLATGPPGRRAA